MKYVLCMLICCLHSAFAGFEQRQLGARGAGLASAFVAVADDAWAIGSNPGGLVQIHRNELSFDFAPDPFGMGELRRASAALAIPLTIGAIGLYASTFGFELYREFTATAAVAKIIGGVGIGIAVNYYSVVIHNYGSSGAFGVDAGAIVALTSDANVGVSMTNVTGSFIGSSREKIPQSFSAGIAYSPLASMRILAQYRKELSFEPSPVIAIEYAVTDEIIVRCGVADEPASESGGIGVRLNGVLLDYALAYHPELGWTHELSLTIRWGGNHD